MRLENFGFVGVVPGAVLVYLFKLLPGLHDRRAVTFYLLAAQHLIEVLLFHRQALVVVTKYVRYRNTARCGASLIFHACALLFNNYSYQLM